MNINVGYIEGDPVISGVNNGYITNITKRDTKSKDIKLQEKYKIDKIRDKIKIIYDRFGYFSKNISNVNDSRLFEIENGNELLNLLNFTANILTDDFQVITNNSSINSIQRWLEKIKEDSKKGFNDLNKFSGERFKLIFGIRYIVEYKDALLKLSSIETDIEKMSFIPSILDSVLMYLVNANAHLGIYLNNQNLSNEFRSIDTKLNNILTDQKTIQNNLASLRNGIFARFDESEQIIIKTVVNYLNRDQLIDIQEAIDVSGKYLLEFGPILEILKNTLKEINQREDFILARNLNQFSDIIDDPMLDASHKLKVTIPIIPLILSYEGFVELKNGMNLKSFWKKLLNRC